METLDESIKTKKCPTILIEDTPSEKDKLAYHGDVGPHERVASAISEIIETEAEPGGKMIGIEGGWGSGKSTVVKLVLEKLKSNKQISFIYFDAWAHEGDPLRRTYLETLINHFIDREWVDSTKWKNEIELLAKRKKITETRTIPKPTILGKIFSVSILLVPTGIPFLNQALKDGLTLNSGNPISWNFIIGLSLAISPLLVILGNFIRVFFQKNKSNPSNWAFLVGNAITESTQQSTETPEPTSIEFETRFRDLMSDALGQNSSQRKALIVLDNLDRIEPKFALSIWSTLQTFLQDRSAKKEDWYKRIWIAIPYDPSGLRLIWEKEKFQTESNNKKTISSSFIDKSFQLKFEVPPLVLSNWKSFLFDLLDEALPKHKDKDDEKLSIYHAFNFGQLDKGSLPTPRELKLFVNDIGSMHRQWQHDFPLSHIAYYIILRKQTEQIIHELRKGTFPSDRLEAMLEPNLRANLAGLAFNVRPELGQQLLLSEPILKSLRENSSVEFDELEVKHGKGFWDVLDQLATESLASADITLISTSSTCIRNSNTFKNDKKPKELKSLAGELKKATHKLDKIEPLNSSIGQGLANLCFLINDATFTGYANKLLIRTLSNVEIPNGGIQDAKELISTVLIIAKQIFSLHHEECIKEPYLLPVKPNEWVIVSNIIVKEDEYIKKLFIPNNKFDGISDYLSTKLGQGELSEPELVTIKFSGEAMREVCDWAALIANIQTRLVADKELNAGEIQILFKALFILRRFNQGASSDVLNYLGSGGHMLHWLQRASTNGDRVAEAWCTIAYLTHNAAGSPSAATVGNSQAGFNILTSILSETDLTRVNDILSIILEFELYQLPFAVIASRNNYDPIILNILRKCIDDGVIKQIFTPQLMDAKWKEIKNQINEDTIDRFKILIEYLCTQTSYVDELMKLEGGFKISNSGLYSSILNHVKSDPFMVWCKNGLLTIDKSVWESELDMEADSLDLISKLESMGVKLDFTSDLQDALIIHSSKMITSGKEIKNKEQWLKVLDSLDKSSRRVFQYRLLEESLLPHSGSVPDHVYYIYGDELLDSEILKKNPATVSKLFSPILRDKVSGGTEWLSKVFSKNKNILDEFSDNDANDDFKSRIQSELSTLDTEQPGYSKVITNIASVLKIKARKKDDDENGIK